MNPLEASFAEDTVAVRCIPLPRAAEPEGPALRRARSHLRLAEPDPNATLPLHAPDGRARRARGPRPFTVRGHRPLAMRCLHCEGLVERGTAPVALDHDGRALRLEVPAWVCRDCGVAYFEPHDVERVRRACDVMDELLPPLL